jgi:hypothetical protein
MQLRSEALPSDAPSFPCFFFNPPAHVHPELQHTALLSLFIANDLMVKPFAAAFALPFASSPAKTPVSIP